MATRKRYPTFEELQRQTAERVAQHNAEVERINRSRGYATPPPPEAPARTPTARQESRSPSRPPVRDPRNVPLGSGLAARARDQIIDRKRRIDEEVEKAEKGANYAEGGYVTKTKTVKSSCKGRRK